MSAEIAVAGRLEADYAVSSLVSDRVYQLKLPQDGELPAIRVQLIDNPQMKHLRGPDGTTGARVQVDAYDMEASGADPYASVEDIANAVNDALVYEPFTVGSVRVLSARREDRRALFEGDEKNTVRIMQDYIVWSRTI
jgi:hypothetical protein